MSEALVVERLSAGYGAGMRVLREVTLPALRPGTVCAVVGPNGAGKSTLLRTVSGLLPGHGTIRLGAADLLSLRPAQRSQIVGFMPQALPARVGFTVFESLMAALGVAPAEGSDPADRAATVLGRLSLLPLAHRSMDRLSGGQAQLASLAVALVRSPRLLLLDEPTSALDLNFQLRAMELVAELAAEQSMIVIASLHDLGLAARWADVMVVLKDGAVAAAGSPARAVTPELLRVAYDVDALVDRDPTGHVRVTVRGRAGPDASSLAAALESRR